MNYQDLIDDLEHIDGVLYRLMRDNDYPLVAFRLQSVIDKFEALVKEKD